MAEAALKQSAQKQLIAGAPSGADSYWLAQKANELMAQDRVLLHIALDDAHIQNIEEMLHFYDPQIEVMIFPAWDCLPYDRISPNKEISAQRMATLARLLAIKNEKVRKPRVLLTSVNAIIQKLPPVSFFDAAAFSAKIGDTINIEQLQHYLSGNGYERVQTVREQGEFAIRGGIIDLFPPSMEEPVRIDLFGDTVDSLRSFDPADQTTTGKVQSFSLNPVTEYLLTPETIEKFRSQYREAFGSLGVNDPLYEAVSEGRRYNGVEHWLPLFYDEMATLFDYLNEPFVTEDYQADVSREERLSQVKDFYDARMSMIQAHKAKQKKSKDVSLSGAVYNPIQWERLFVPKLGHDVLGFVPFQGAEGQMIFDDMGVKKGHDFAEIRNQQNGDVFGALKAHIEAQGDKVVIIAAYSEGSRTRLKGLLETASIKDLQEIDTFKDIKKLREKNRIGLAIIPVEQGLVFDDFIILTEQDILGDRLSRTSKTKKRKSDNFIREVSALAEGDYIIHMDHGIGRFMGLETLEAAGTRHDCLKLVYAGDDRLFIPVENIDMLSRYSGSDSIVQLDKLGGAGWQARKARVKKNLMEIADELLKIAAARQLKQADKLEIPEGLYNEFAARFPYPETDDQLRAIYDVMMDLKKGMPMDRLVCGDVGFGKTEIAIRATFIAAMSGDQVAIVAPTTLLARQHFENFNKRFAGTGLRVAQLSRMVSAKEAKLVRDGLREGSIHIVIGTHALFAQETKFAKLGLLIVDEEQRFGVKQKEKLKALKENVHVLTLTATPIPRTLQMSLTGVKEMSIIATPPVDRLAIRTFVLPYDPLVIREALLREYHRGGQSFYVCPRVKDIQKLKEALDELVPELKVIAVHGQLTPTELEERMNAFYDRQYDILLATNIIESGIDIPTANTMIIHRADMFGLAQLYQIRGRIGRSKLRGYAYLTYEQNKVLGAIAVKRLEVLEMLDTLGAGFQLASHDMDIRGSGNLLGEQQSGHIKEVGVELYQQMLEDAVAAARDGIGMDDLTADDWSPMIQLGTSVLIPEHYVDDLSLRLSLYRRAGELEDHQAIEAFATELIDRFGPIPDEVENLLTIIGIKQLCKKAGIEKIDAGPKGAVISFHKSFASPEKVIELIQKNALFKLRPDQKLVRTASWNSVKERVNGVRALVVSLV
ncbi:MAG: transcription-repair coupling factor [Micavibrio sp.]|nr:transcription-repair coupling factor [Micavibrio sp.]